MVRAWHILRLAAMLLLGIVVITAPGGSMAQPVPGSERINGAYRVVFGGFLTGSGNGIVTPKLIIITASQLSDETGASGNFQARCPRDGNHFSGTGSGPGGSFTVKGRLDPSNKTLKASRLSFTYISSAGKAGRAAGDRR